MKDKDLKNIGLSALFLAIGLVLPFFTGQIPRIGNMLLPMHIPVFVCSFVCGWKYGAVMGITLPLIRSVVFGMPVLYPVAIAMSVELAIYGLVSGLIYGRSKKQNVKIIYVALLVAMIGGRVCWGVAELLLLGMMGNIFTWQMFIAGAFINAIPGIILQLILIPAIIVRFKVTERI